MKFKILLTVSVIVNIISLVQYILPMWLYRWTLGNWEHQSCWVYFDVFVMWTCVDAANAGGGGKELHRVKQQNKQLKEENNLLKIKIDLLLDMVSV